jgi:hypothetical protein
VSINPGKGKNPDASAQGNLQGQACGRRTAGCGGVQFGHHRTKFGRDRRRHLRVHQRDRQWQRLHEHRDQLAVGIGNNTTANASGLFDGAVATGLTGTQGTLAESFGNFSLAYAGGPNVVAIAGTPPSGFGPGGGNFNLAVAQGSNVAADAGAANANGTDIGNAAFNIANDPGTSPPAVG